VPCACNEQGAIAPSERTASVAATVSSVGPVPTAAPAAKQAFGKSCMASFDKQASCKDIYVKTVARGRGALGFSLPSLLDKKDEWSAACGGFEEATHVGQLTERAAALDKCSAEAECAAFATCAGDIWMSFYERGGAEMPWCITPIEADRHVRGSLPSSDHLTMRHSERRHGVQDLASDPGLHSL